jgi:transcriptional regulator with XRE-family HTH domain
VSKKQKKTDKKVSAYDTPTPEKKAFGARMRKAREDHGMTLTDAAHKLGYSQAVQMSNMENGFRMPPMRLLMQCTELYGTTMDYLCGFAQDSDRDPAVSIVRLLTASASADFKRLIDTVTETSVDIARKVLPTAAAGERVAASALEAHSALLRFAELNPKFQDMRAGNVVMSKSEAAARNAREYMDSMLRARRVLAAKSSGESLVAAAGAPTAQLKLIAMEEC